MIPLMANESGAVKRVMFDGGYDTFSDAGVPNWHYTTMCVTTQGACAPLSTCGSDRSRRYNIRSMTHSHPLDTNFGNNDNSFIDGIVKGQIRKGFYIPDFYIYHVPSKTYIKK